MELDFNGGQCSKGTRIILGWDAAIRDVMVLSQTDQVMHLQVILKNDRKVLFCSIVYVDNYHVSRRNLLCNLVCHKQFIKHNPWVMMGDFNCALNLEDKCMGSSVINAAMREFKECVEQVELIDINSPGLNFTWNQKPKQGVGILKKIDWVIWNMEFMGVYPNAAAIFQPYTISDHTPCYLV